MRKLPVFVVALLLGLASIGCDSNEDDLTDAEILLGTWTLVQLTDDEGDKTAAFAQLANSFEATLNNDDTYEINVDYKAETGRDPLVILGTYEVKEGDKTLEISTPLGQDIPFLYDIEEEDRVQLAANAQFINALFNATSYVGTVEITIEK